MPRVYPPRRTLIAFRIKPEALDVIDAQAKAEGVDRSAMVRTLLGEALTARQRRKTR
jgi:hypothetical protein